MQHWIATQYVFAASANNIIATASAAAIVATCAANG